MVRGEAFIEGEREALGLARRGERLGELVRPEQVSGDAERFLGRLQIGLGEPQDRDEVLGASDRVLCVPGFARAKESDPLSRRRHEQPPTRGGYAAEPPTPALPVGWNPMGRKD